MDGRGYGGKYEKESEYKMGVRVGGGMMKKKVLLLGKYEGRKKEYGNVYGVEWGNWKVNREEGKDIVRMVENIRERERE